MMNDSCQHLGCKNNSAYWTNDKQYCVNHGPYGTLELAKRQGLGQTTPGTTLSELAKEIRDAQAASDRQEGGNHYKKLEIEPWDVVDTWPQEQKIGFYRGNALKYIMRMGSKDENLQEIKKARHYLDKLIEMLK